MAMTHNYVLRGLHFPSNVVPDKRYSNRKPMMTLKRRYLWLSVFILLMCLPLRTLTLLFRPRSSRFYSLSSLVMLGASLKILNLLLKWDCGISILQSATG